MSVVWDYVLADILLVVKGDKIPVDLSVLLAPGKGESSETLTIYWRYFRVGEFLRHMMMFDMRGFGKGTPAVFR